MDRKGDFRARATQVLTPPAKQNHALPGYQLAVPVEVDPGPPGARYRSHQVFLDFEGFTLGAFEIKRSMVTAAGMKLPGKPGVAHGYEWGTAVNWRGDPVGNYFAEFSENYIDGHHIGRWAIVFGTGQLEGIEAVAAISARRVNGELEIWLIGSYSFP